MGRSEKLHKASIPFFRLYYFALTLHHGKESAAETDALFCKAETCSLNTRKGKRVGRCRQHNTVSSHGG